jgi:Na+/phosphate symporter
MIAIVPVIAVLAGALCYALSANPKVQELGRITFACGMLVLIYTLAGHIVRL